MRQSVLSASFFLCLCISGLGPSAVDLHHCANETSGPGVSTINFSRVCLESLVLQGMSCIALLCLSIARKKFTRQTAAWSALQWA